MGKNSPQQQSKLPSFLALFASLGTLLCCALLSLLVLLGLGATVASFLSALPWLVTLARDGLWVFIVSGVLISSDFVSIYWLAPRLKARGDGCSIEEGRNACSTATRMSRAVLWVATAVYAAGFFTAFLLAPVFFG